jgi:cytochrome c-type biogenesis protein CcmE
MPNEAKQSDGVYLDPGPATSGNLKFIIGGLLILAGVIYLAVSSLLQPGGSQYFLTVEELKLKKIEMAGRDVRVSGAVLGETIRYDPETLELSFSMANIPADTNEIEARGGLARVLHEAAQDENLAQVKVVYNGPRPDLLQNEAQAIVTGSMGEDGALHAQEVLLKCPTRYDEAVPGQANGD